MYIQEVEKAVITVLDLTPALAEKERLTALKVARSSGRQGFRDKYAQTTRRVTSSKCDNANFNLYTTSYVLSLPSTKEDFITITCARSIL